MTATPQILFIQGGGTRVHDEWDVQLVDSLQRELGLQVRYPRMIPQLLLTVNSHTGTGLLSQVQNIHRLDTSAAVDGRPAGFSRELRR